jgi:hypothetical protein
VIGVSPLWALRHIGYMSSRQGGRRRKGADYVVGSTIKAIFGRVAGRNLFENFTLIVFLLSFLFKPILSRISSRKKC